MADPLAEVSFACLYMGRASECQNCGGWTKAEGGPSEADARFCSDDCYEDHLEFTERARREVASDWCPSCGYDRHEHAPDCARKVA